MQITRNKSKYRWASKYVFEVYFSEYLGHYALTRGEKNGAYDDFTMSKPKSQDLEVIGNIYENKDLLKE